MKLNAEKSQIDMIRGLGIVSPADLVSRGISRSRLYSLVQKGLIERRGRGIYVARNHALTAEHSLAQAAKRVRGGVICLLSALSFHDVKRKHPADVYIAIPEKARKIRLDYPRLRINRFSGAALTEGVEVHSIEGVNVRVYSAAKTVADCFKYRNKVGVDVAVEALREFSRRHRGGATELARFARICRVTRGMQPYLDAIV